MNIETLNLKEICLKLQVADRHCKIAAFDKLRKLCEESKSNQDNILMIFDESYLNILKCYSDRYESVRNKAAQTVSEFIEYLPPNDFHLLNIVSTLFERMGHEETLEESEEMRLTYVQQLHSLIARYTVKANEALEECFDFFSSILKKAFRDAHPGVQREACACVVTLSRSSNRTTRFQKLADNLAKSLYYVLNHKHSLTRVAAIEALGCLSLHLDCNGDALSRLIMEVSPLLMDPMPLVRRECGNMGIVLLLDLPDRYSYFERIIPLVLCCLKDETSEVVSFIRPLWIKCGQQYFEENETELRKQEIGDTMPENYPQGVERPTIGCRAIVQRSLRLLSLITRESSDWKDNVRLHSLKLLYQFVLHAEAAMTAKFLDIYPEVARACRDYEYTVSKEAMKVADLMGRLFSYDDWFEYGFDNLVKNAREGYLKCFYAMFNSAAYGKLSDLLRISKVLLNPDFSQTLKPDIQKYVIKLAEVILAKSEKHKKRCIYSDDDDHLLFNEIDKNLYIITVKVLALSTNTEISKGSELQIKAEQLLNTIANRQSVTVPILHEKFMVAALQFVQNLDAPLDGCSEPILLLKGLLGISKFRATFLTELQEKINDVWQSCSSEAKIKVFSVISTEMLHWSETINRDIDESVRLLTDFLKSVVERHLSWRVGTTAEAMRSLAIATLCAVSQGALKEAQIILPYYAQFIPALLEDHSINTRHYAIKCVMNFGEVPVENLKPIAHAILQRLDDPSGDIRTLAATAISKMRPKFVEGNSTEEEYEREIWNVFLNKALDVLLIHYEGPDQRLNDFIRGTIMEFACDHPNIVMDSFKRADQLPGSKSVKLQELRGQLPNSLWNS